MNNNGDHTLETINAAATAVASVEERVPQVTVHQKKKWSGWLSLYWCFGAHKHQKRIGHAVFSPETGSLMDDVPAAQSSNLSNGTTLPFVAPPSSPASFIQSEPPSATQSPACLLSLTSMSASMYSPSGPRSIFAIGPYAHETQLVSPPVFSTFTTEPSTAPITPPPELVHLTTPSSPEVPFAHLLNPELRYGDAQKLPFSLYGFQSYLLSPGSPVGNLISPSSGISGSGTSSPFPGLDFASNCPNFKNFQPNEPTNLPNFDKLSTYVWGSMKDSGVSTPDPSKQKSQDGYLLDHKVSSLTQMINESQNSDSTIRHRMSFQLPREEDVRKVGAKPSDSTEAVPSSSKYAGGECESSCNQLENDSKDGATETDTTGEERRLRHRRHRSITLGSSREFNFDNPEEGDAHQTTSSSTLWSNEKVDDEEDKSTKNWPFFPVMQPGLS